MNNQSLTQSDINTTDFRSQLKQKTQNQESKNGGFRFIQVNSLTIYFFKTAELNGSSYRKTPVGSSVVLKTDNDDEFGFVQSMRAHLHALADSKIGQPTRV